MKEKLKVVWSIFLRFGLSAGLLAWLFTRIDYRDTWAAVKGADKGYMLAAFAVFSLTCFMILWRWIILMKALHLKFKRYNSARWFFVGQLFNLVLPTSVGGDVIKGFGISKETGHKPKVFASIVLDRLTGFAGIVIVAFASFFFGRRIVGNSSLLISIVILTIFSLGLTLVLFSRRLFSWTCKVFSIWPKVKEALMQWHHDIVLMRGKQKEFIETVGISILAQMVLAYDFYLTSQGLHQSISLVYFIIFSPLVCVVTNLPSIGGLGVREVGWVGLLSLVGVHREVAVGLSLINFAFMVIVGLLGGLFYVSTLSSGRLQYYQTDRSLKPRHTGGSASGLAGVD